jgi:hypothetical protein
MNINEKQTVKDATALLSIAWSLLYNITDNDNIAVHVVKNQRLSLGRIIDKLKVLYEPEQ